MVSQKVARVRRLFRKAPYFVDSNLDEIRPILTVLCWNEKHYLSTTKTVVWMVSVLWAHIPHIWALSASQKKRDYNYKKQHSLIRPHS